MLFRSLGKRNAMVTLTSFDPIERESPLQITLVQALATSDKMDFIVQKAVELGVTSIQPISTERATLNSAVIAPRNVSRTGRRSCAPRASNAGAIACLWYLM